MTKPTRVLNLQALDALMRARRSVVCPTSPCWCRPRPAAFVIQLTGEIILRLIQAGLYVYEKPAKVRGSKRFANKE